MSRHIRARFAVGPMRHLESACPPANARRIT